MSTYSQPPSGVELKQTNSGDVNPKYIDLLEEDKPIAGQKFACLSFVSPESILKQKDHFFFEKFLHYWDYQKSMEKFIQFLNFVSFKYHISFDKMSADFQEFAKEEKDVLQKTNIYDEYKTFLDKHEDDLEAEFNEKHNFQTSVRGLKVRGVFGSQKEAELRCQMLREVDPNHDVFVGPVGMWVPFHPDAYKTGRVEYMEETLNQLMAEKKKNEEQAKTEFDKRVKETKAKAIQENIKLAKESGNKLTQMLAKDGETLVDAKPKDSVSSGASAGDAIESVGGGIWNAGDDSSSLSMTVEEMRKELFEGEDVVMDKNSDHGLSRLSSSGAGAKEMDNVD
jgi:ElaB/YqjD/DUF883 family membrane-anchored ribosome-binding protein